MLCASARIVVLLGLFLATLPPARAEREVPEGDPRVSVAEADLATAREVLAALTNEADVVLWRRRVALAEKELRNARRLVELEQVERNLAARRQVRLDYELRDALGAVDALAPENDLARRARNDLIKQLNARKSDLLPEPDDGPQTEEESAARAAREAALRNIGAQLAALNFEGEAAETHHRLIAEAKRIRELLATYEQNPNVTVRLLVSKRQNLGTVRNKLKEFRMLADDLQARIGETTNSINLARERQAGLAESIGILQHRYRVEKPGLLAPALAPEKAERIRRLRHMLDTTQSEQTALAERIGYLERQSAALAGHGQVAQRAVELIAREQAFLSEEWSLLAGRYVRHTLFPLGVVVALVLLYSLSSRYVFPRFLTADSLFVTRRLGGYVLALLIVLMLTAFFMEDLKAIATVMGIVGAAIVIALQDMCSAFAGWFVIVTCRKMKLGDRVEIDGRRGDVIDIQMLRVTLLELNNWLGVDEPTGRILIIPNSFIFKSHVFNYSHVHPYITGRLDVTVTFETPAAEAEDLLARLLKEENGPEAAEAAAHERKLHERYGLVHPVFEPHVHTKIADSGILFSLHYVAHYRRYAAMFDRISSRVVREFAKDPRMAFAYPTQRHIPTPEAGGLPVALARPAGKAGS